MKVTLPMRTLPVFLGMVSMSFSISLIAVAFLLFPLQILADSGYDAAYDAAYDASYPDAGYIGTTYDNPIAGGCDISVCYIVEYEPVTGTPVYFDPVTGLYFAEPPPSIPPASDSGYPDSGYAVPGLCSAQTGLACSTSANACGALNTGTIQCSGSCSVVNPPALIPNFGASCISSPNLCAMTTTGTILCNGACSASTPPDSSCPLPPDLVAQNLASSGTLVVGYTVTFSGNITNQGGTSAAASSARFCVDNANCLTTTTGSLSTDPGVLVLASGASSAASRSWTATTGTHTAYLCADVGSAVAESNETNNCSQMTLVVSSPVDLEANNCSQIGVVVSAQPDLITQNLASSGVLVAGNTVTFSGNVKNQGSSSADVSTARFCVDNASCLTSITGQLSPDQAVASLVTGATVVLSSRTWTATNGTHIAYLCADVGSAVAESNETNNCSQITLVVSSQADLVVQNFGSAGILIVGNTITFSGNVKNQGSSPAVGSNARFCIDNVNCLTSTTGRLLTDQIVEALAAGASSVLLSSPWTAISGSHTAYLCADVGNAVPESNETNNCSQVTVGVVFPPPDVILCFGNPICATVPSGGTAVIPWSTQNVASCTVTGTNGDLFTGTSGSRTTSPITQTTTYAIACIDLNNVPTETKSTIVQLRPRFEEF